MNTNQTHNTFPTFDINEEDIDSDVLSEEESGSDEGDVEEMDHNAGLQSGFDGMGQPNKFLQDSYYDNPYEPFDEEEEQYKEFLRSVRFYDDSNLDFEKNPLLDDEEEYEPEAFEETSDLDEIDEDEDDLNSDGGDLQDPDYDDDAEFFDHINDMTRVRPKELKELLGDSWRTITDHTTQNNGQHKSRNSNDDGGHAALNSNSLFSSLLAQFFAGQQLTEATIDNIPLSTFRKLVARQMSMSLQLLIQILIQAEDKSTCFTRGTQCLLALNNFRMAAVKKAALLQVQVENMLAVKLQMNSNNQQTTASSTASINHYPTENNNMTNNFQLAPNNKAKILRKHQIEQLMQEVAPQLLSTKPQQPQAQIITAEVLPVVHAFSSQYQRLQQQAAVPVVDQQEEQQNLVGRRMTRSNYINYDLQSKRSSSILDVPILSHMNELLQQIDIAQKRYRAQVLQVAMDQQLATVNNQHQILLADYALSQPGFRRRILRVAASELENVFVSLQLSQQWQCLIQLSNYPFSAVLHAQLDPTLTTSRSYFTPAEDDLLLRGILHYGDQEDSWHRIREHYLPSKDIIMLRCHYNEKTTIKPGGLNTNNIFRRFQSIRDRGWIENCPKEDRWQHLEDLALVRGFMVCGPQWPHIIRLLLPHRRPKDIRLRWRALIKTWQRAFPLEQQSSQYLRTMLMTPKLAAFLLDLQQCKDLPALQLLRREGGHHLQQLEFPLGNDKQGVSDNAHLQPPRAEFELDPSSLNDISCDELSDDDANAKQSNPDNRANSQPSPDVDSFQDSGEEANNAKSKKKVEKGKKQKVIQLDANGEPVKRRIHRKRAASNPSPLTIFASSADLETFGKGKRQRMNANNTGRSSSAALLPVLDDLLMMAPAPPPVAAIAVVAAAPQLGLGVNENTMDELMGFSNFTRDMSMLKASFRQEEGGGVRVDQQLQFSQLSSSSRLSQQQSSSKIGPPREGGLFASVMSGASFK